LASGSVTVSGNRTGCSRHHRRRRVPKRRSLTCTINHDAIIARGSTMRERKRAVQQIAHKRGALV
jgi:hypothetical protein